MSPFIIQGILKFEKSSTNCVVFNKRLIIAPGTILENFVRDSNSTEILESLMKNKSNIFPKDISFTVKFKDMNESLGPLQVCEAKLLTGFFSTEVYEILTSFVPEFIDNISHCLKSYFIVLELPGKSDVSIENVFKSFYTECFKNKKLEILDDILSVSTPFNNEAFYSTVHLAKVANVKKQILFVLSGSLPRECEGSPVFNSKLKLIGLILFTSLRTKKENFNLTCAVSFQTIVRSFLRTQGLVSAVESFQEKAHHYLLKSLVKVHGNNLQGSGVMVSIGNKQYILTCSHVLDGFQIGDIVNCQYFEGRLSSRLIWRNEKFENPYDLAILAPETVLPHIYYSSVSTNCHVGQEVFAVGFPFYSTSEDEFNPSVYKGHITRHNRFVIQHDATVQSGQSGGPLLDAQGKVLGICVSNLKCDDEIYPEMCLCIPLEFVQRSLKKFNKSGDVRDLDNLGDVSYDGRQSWNVEAKL